MKFFVHIGRHPSLNTLLQEEAFKTHSWQTAGMTILTAGILRYGENYTLIFNNGIIVYGSKAFAEDERFEEKTVIEALDLFKKERKTVLNVDGFAIIVGPKTVTIETVELTRAQFAKMSKMVAEQIDKDLET